MKFGDKYELLDSLTTGSVETFVANDKLRGERVLVHILHCDPQRPNQPTVQWVLDTFRRVAPEPAGLVLEAGRYSGTLYAYLITKLPDEAAVQAWVKQYKAQARDTQEITARPLQPPAPVSPLPPVPVSSQPLPPPPPPTPPAPTPGSVTQLLREFEPLTRKTAPNVPPKEAQPPSPPPFSTTDRSGIRPAPSWNPEPPRMATPPKPEPIRTPPADPFPTNFLDKNFPGESSAAPATPPAKESPKLGEFTSFFQGPFRGDRPSETPNISPPPEPPRKTVGDFTAMFGAVKPQPEEPLPTSEMTGKGMAGNEPAGTGFTGWFNSDLPSRTSSTPFNTTPVTPPSSIPSTLPNPFASPTPNTTLPPSGLPRATDHAPVFPEPLREPFAPPQPGSYVAPAPPIFPSPAPPNPMPDSPASALPPDGATRAFSRPGIGEAAPAPPPPPSGPSAYTQIISVRAPSPAEEATTAEKEGPKSITPPAFTPPPLPPLPKLAPPPPPPPPPMPKFAAPKLPPPPKAPKVEVPVPPVSYWPLVLTLTVVFVLAVLVVLYFVLKH